MIVIIALYLVCLFRHRWKQWLCINSKWVFWTYLPSAFVISAVHVHFNSHEVPWECAILNSAHDCILHLTLDFCPNLLNKASPLCTCNFTVSLSTEIFNTLDMTDSARKSLLALLNLLPTSGGDWVGLSVQQPRWERSGFAPSQLPQWTQDLFPVPVQ